MVRNELEGSLDNEIPIKPIIDILNTRVSVTIYAKVYHNPVNSSDGMVANQAVNSIGM